MEHNRTTCENIRSIKRRRTAPSKTEVSANLVPCPERREFSGELRELGDRVRELRESIEKEKDAISIGYFAAALHVEFIGRIVTFTDQLDEALDYRLFLEDHPLQENLRRANSALRIYKTLTDMLCEEIEGLLLCLGGMEVVAAQAMGKWAANDPVRTELLDRVLKIAFVLPRKGPRKRET